MKKRVLIVDDVADIRLMLRYIIEKGDYQVVAEAANGIEAVQKYREHLPDLTIMDIDMPFKSGVEAAREIREIAADARIIFCSGGVANYDKALKELSIDGHCVIAKPFLPAQLYEAMAYPLCA
jgi:two-component system, chemotaxis family, chemotaxis protein CheY